MTARPPIGGAQRPTLEVVAARAGVSRATASRVLRGATNVSPEARESVLRAADEISYTVNLAARSLVTRRSDSIAFLVAEQEDRLFRDPYFLGVLRGAQAAAAGAGQQMVVVIASTPAERETFLRFASGGHADGVLLVSLHGDNELAEQLERIGVPTVLNGRPFDPNGGLYSVDVDNVAGARAATRTLLALGAVSPVTITGAMDMTAARDRLEGFRQALTDAGHTSPVVTAGGDFTTEGGAAAMAHLLDTSPDLDAVFAASDMMALGALRVLTERGVRVPDDVAVIGFDDIREAQAARPDLSTVHQPLADLGSTMTQLLLERISGVAPDQRRVLLPTSVIRRGSA